MLNRRHVALGVLALAGCAGAQKAEHGPPQAQIGGSQSTTLHFSAYGLPFADVRVNGEAALALIDTGSASAIRLSGRLTRQLGLPLSDLSGRTVRGLDGAQMAVLGTRVAVFALGAHQFQDERVEVIPHRLEAISEQVGTPFDVQLGWQFLAREDLRLDFRNRRLWLGARPDAAPPTGVRLPLRPVGSLPVVSAWVSGQPIDLLVDTGAPMCNLDPSRAKAAIGSVVELTLQLGTTMHVVRWRVKDLSVTMRALGTAGTLGNNFLMDQVLHFGATQQVITFH
jgi:predicted aspartyl protease